MLFSIIIINHNQDSYLVRCIESIREHFPADYEIIVVDNSGKQVNYDTSGIKIIESGNKGFADANNTAAKHASGRYLLFLNADTEFTGYFIPVFEQNLAGKEFGAAGIGLKYPGGGYQLSYWNTNTFFNEIRNKKLEQGIKNNDADLIRRFSGDKSVREVDWVSGAAMIIPKEVYESVNGFDERFFLFYEDADICERIKEKGFKILYLPFDGLVHHKGENVNDMFHSDTYFYSKKSQMLYYRLHNGLIQRALLRIYLILKFGMLSVTSGGVNRRIFRMLTGAGND